MISTVVFDIGEVLVDFRWEAYIEELGFSPEITDRLKKATVLNKLWKEQDRGDYEMEDLIRLHMTVDAGLEWELRTFFENIGNIVRERSYAAPLLKFLKEKGYRVYLLSNFGKHAFSQASPGFRFRDYTDGEVISFEVNSIKPEWKMYLVLREKYHLVPESCLFIDDQLPNVETAAKMNFKVLRFRDPGQMIRGLSEKGVDMEGFPDSSLADFG